MGTGTCAVRSDRRKAVTAFWTMEKGSKYSVAGGDFGSPRQGVRVLEKKES
eukprot:CAMPEP_0196667490 /NCGR_PEP_ID=MMETSP1086-20130531/65095_1 /TAXON_ID=77921 /ORGANISM="Cyanoptyche  gloeocystis , Strain SAG4.97" /LENGTH=50 /DNA_ID=CAMNT_0042004823 /DNA_START=554 /DNA_END=706 /DNA_ORIENTATION=+